MSEGPWGGSGKALPLKKRRGERPTCHGQGGEIFTTVKKGRSGHLRIGGEL